MNQALPRGLLAWALIGTFAGCASTGSVDPKADIAPDKVVYHVNDAGAQAVAALRNINNHLGVAEITRLQQREGYAYLRP